ncbi:class II aldolase/adducin domain-containing protein [Phakopsora pachyrhizi]|uniref:Class II aldolase/adducin domain-containing protein n=1 Tax=Phakopsora pachyrhizi TaxID=170000 RepID=A0AAV0B7I9_PHAPC|nr:class II aldolase/adducin domain-containing protein [Phakopsora pachyrhizi]CAH7683099.1 class II aldolase/adducin domain-containing protein [Phakopsora pachyrhizi]
MSTESQVLNPTSLGADGSVQPNAKEFKIIPLPKFQTKEEERSYKLGRLAAGFRIFAKHGFDEGLAGHMTLRDPILTDHFWVNPIGLAFSLMTVSDLLLVNPEGKIVQGGKPERQIYNQTNLDCVLYSHALHTARLDIEAACHSHSVYGRAFSTLGINLDITTQDACAFYDDLAHYGDFGGVVVDGDEGKSIAKALGNKKAVIMQNHGILTTSTTIDAAVFWFIQLESLCRIQLLADAAAAGRNIKTIKVRDEEAKFTYKITGSPIAAWAQAQPYFDQIHKETDGAYLL